ncbi:MAG: DNA polymerase III subunit delta, partial [Rickettsiales bacterium]|nr:DNA polymerase III subunit delta [Rickettsiales bacterium]
MKIQAKLIDKFITNSLNDIESLLLYGPDAGLISERKINITKQILGENFDDLNYTHIEASSIKKDPSILDNEINSISLMQERKLIIISGCPTNFGKIAENSLNNKKSDNFVIFLASELSPSSNLRKLFENKNNLAALPCYNDDKYTVISLIKEAFPNKSLDHDVIEYIANNISGDRQLIKKEIEKLQIYFHGKKEVIFNDVVNLLVENIESDYQIFANEFMNKNFSKAIIICDDLLASGEQEI